MSSDDEIARARTLLVEAGYLVTKIPPCNRGDANHGRHSLITRTAVCEGGGVIPHGYHGTHMGSFGWWMNCQCGHSFADYGLEGEETPWEQHKREHGFAEPPVAAERSSSPVGAHSEPGEAQRRRLVAAQGV
jgi:hypothetical protein